MGDRPYVLLSVAMSLDGCIDDASDTRLILSGEPDLDRVDEVRASCDAILIGAGTVRRDNPRLLVRSPARRARRLAAGLPISPAKVVISGSGILDPAGRLFAAGAGSTAGPAAGSGTAAGAGVTKLVYVSGPAAPAARRLLAGLATVVAAGDPLDLGVVLADLAARGIGRLMVEGGSSILTQFLAAGLADELQLAIAPVLVGDAAAPRLISAGQLPHGPGRPLALAQVSTVGEIVLLRYRLGTIPAS